MELGIQCTTRNKSRKWTRALMTNQSLLEACTVPNSIQTGSVIASFSINCIVWYYQQFNKAKLCKCALLTLWPYLHTLTGGQTLWFFPKSRQPDLILGSWFMGVTEGKVSAQEDEPGLTWPDTHNTFKRAAFSWFQKSRIFLLGWNTVKHMPLRFGKGSRAVFYHLPSRIQRVTSHLSSI